MVDGNYFRSYTYFSDAQQKFQAVAHTTIEQGDGKLASIAAASILAKVARDQYIVDLCEEHPELHDQYGLRDNKGYGSATHMEGLKTYGVTKWHRLTFNPCKNAFNSMDISFAHRLFH